MDELLSREQVAALLGISPVSVRQTLARHGVFHQSGWSAAEVEQMKTTTYRLGRGRRTDLEKKESTS